MEQNKETKKGLESYLPYLIAGVLLVCVVIGAIFLFGNGDKPGKPTEPDWGQHQIATGEPAGNNDPTQNEQPTQGMEIQPTQGNADPEQTDAPATEQPTQAPATEPNSETKPTETKPTDPPATEAPGHVHTVLMDIPEMWEDYMSRELLQLDKGSRQVFYTEVQGARVDLFAVTFGFVDESKNGFPMGIYAADCGDKIQVAIESYPVTPQSNWTDADVGRVNAMREEINTIIAQLRQILVD